MRKRMFALLLLLALLASLLPVHAETLPPDEAEAAQIDLLDEDSEEAADETDIDAQTAASEPVPVLQLDMNAEKVQYVTTSRVALKMRRSPGINANGCGSIRRGEEFHVLSMDMDWAKVRRIDTEAVGYVQCKYFETIYRYDEATGGKGEVFELPDVLVPAGQVTANGFVRNFIGHAVAKTVMYTSPDTETRIVASIPIYQQLYVNSFSDDGWAYCEFDNRFGYIRTDRLFKFDRIDPYAGAIPGCIVYPLMAIVGQTTDILAYDGSGKVLKTIYPGAAICVEEPDAQGRYKTPYWRTTGYITDDQIHRLVRVAPWKDAQPGDMISVMTTYYALGISSAEYQGRNWNIYYSSTILSSRRLDVGEQLNMNDVIGPYTKGKGYKIAPIASPKATAGYGGGTCQVNTTMYNVLIQLPIFINHRQVHANAGAKYFLKGFDAAVGSRDAINMIFTNTLPYPIRINFWISDGALTVALYRAEE